SLIRRGIGTLILSSADRWPEIGSYGTATVLAASTVDSQFAIGRLNAPCSKVEITLSAKKAWLSRPPCNPSRARSIIFQHPVNPSSGKYGSSIFRENCWQVPQ